MLTFQEQVDLRRHLGVPVSGVSQSGTILRIMRLEFLMVHLAAEEESVITGNPYSVVQILGNVVEGQSLTLTFQPNDAAPLTPVVYTTTLPDQQAQDPRLSVALNLSNAINLAGLGVMSAGGALMPTTQPSILPAFSQCTIMSSQFSFNTTVAATGGLAIYLFRDGYYPSPQLQYVDPITGLTESIYGMLPICNYLENSIYSASDNLEIDAAGAGGPVGGAKIRHDELNQREILYNRACRKLSKMFGAWGN